MKVIADSNILIYSMMMEYDFLRHFMTNYTIKASAISKIEVLGFTRLSKEDEIKYQRMLARVELFPVIDSVLNQAILLKQQKKMSLGDSIIASTALLQGLPLMTRNVGDFAWINGLQLINPFDE